VGGRHPPRGPRYSSDERSLSAGFGSRSQLDYRGAGLISIPPRGIVDGMSEQHGHLEGNDAAVQAHLKRLRRIEGQVRGIQRMVEDEKYCIDILTQVSAMTKALQSVALGLLEEHMSHCVVEAVAAGGPEADTKVKEATDAIARLVRS